MQTPPSLIVIIRVSTKHTLSIGLTAFVLNNCQFIYILSFPSSQASEENTHFRPVGRQNSTTGIQLVDDDDDETTMVEDTTSSSSKLSAASSPSIPLISLAPLLSTSLSASKQETAQALLSAFRHSGFLYLTEYFTLIPPTLLKNVFTQSAYFFALSLATKTALAWTTPRANRGYTRMGREKTSAGLSAAEVAVQRLGEGEDMKESFEIGREGEAGCPNRWLDDDDSEEGKGEEEGAAATTFRATMLEFHDQCKEIHRVLMRGIALALGLDEGFFDGFTKRGDNTLRLLHYPAVPVGGFDEPATAAAGGGGGQKMKKKKVRAGAHTDYGSLTLLFQDARGGLQVDPEGVERWIDVVPIEGTIVVNAADLLMRWSNDLIKSTRHRVVEPPLPPTPAAAAASQEEEEEGGGGGDGSGESDASVDHPARYSIAYFCNPDFDGYIEAIPGTWETEQEKKYPGVNSGDYLAQRLSATY